MGGPLVLDDPAVGPAAPQSFAEWKADAVAVMGGEVVILPEREWKRLYVAGVDPRSSRDLRKALSASPGFARP